MYAELVDCLKMNDISYDYFFTQSYTNYIIMCNERYSYVICKSINTFYKKSGHAQKVELNQPSHISCDRTDTYYDESITTLKYVAIITDLNRSSSYFNIIILSKNEQTKIIILI